VVDCGSEGDDFDVDVGEFLGDVPGVRKVREWLV
jgi:hypothetical protein